MKNDKKPNKELGNRVRELRNSKNLTQDALAKKLNYTTKYIGDLENARRRITPQAAELMANLFRIDANYLLDETVKYKSDIDKFNCLLGESEKENALIINTICSLAALNGYNVEIQDLQGNNGENNINDYFKRRKEFIAFYRNGKKEFSLSFDDANRFGNIISENFMSYIKWNIKQE